MLTPAIGAIGATLVPRMMARSVQVQGQIAVVDPTGAVGGELADALSSARITARRTDQARQVLIQAPESVRQVAGNDGGRAARFALGSVPEFTIVQRPPDADLKLERAWLTDEQAGPRHLALIVIHANAVRAGARRVRRATDLFVPPNVDDRVEGEIYQGLREAIIGARIKAQALDRAAIDSLVRVARVKSVTVTKNDQRQTVAGFNMLLPGAFAVLLFIGVMTGGQALLTSTVEEKSSRVIEILLVGGFARWSCSPASCSGRWPSACSRWRSTSGWAWRCSCRSRCSACSTRGCWCTC